MFEPEYTISSATRGVWRLIEIQVPTCKECNGPRAKSCRLCLCQVRPSCSAREGLRELSQLATGLERAQHAHTPEAWQKSLAKISITLARAYLSSSQHGGHDGHNALSLLRLRSTAKDRPNASYAERETPTWRDQGELTTCGCATQSIGQLTASRGTQ